MALALILVVIAVIAPTNYVIAKTNTNNSLYGLMGGTKEEEIGEETEG